MLGCTVPNAKNYNPAATEDDGSCIYLESVGGQCYQFEDAESLTDHSFSMSIVLNAETMQPEGWAFYHDYFPDFYIHTRDKLMNLKDGTGFYNSEGVRGKYHGNTVHPFFIDVLVSDKKNMILNSINWVTEVRNSSNDEIDDNQPALFGETLTAITIWNNYQTSGRILLDKGILSLQKGNNRNSEDTWNFNDFRNVLENLDEQFLSDIFDNFTMDESKLNKDMAWFDKRLIEGNYFIIRFEFDNNNNKQITVHNVDADVSQSYR